ncbi:MAG: hypothetical protein A2028_02765 [Candidatus Aminicenantes bacterium RBG_19FT_COMBO_59_29]|nr:MAG: hypothetical protein A2028_02765 [Candidatus Aminicenantes bacterium RBG_19FT_COMBO_59_29]
MGLINSILGKLFDLLLLPFRSLNPWAGMAFISLLTGLLMLLIYRLTSNQSGIRRVKDKIKAHLLELRLFKENMGVTMRAQGQILRANLRYLALNLKPLLVMIVPLVLILSQLNLWFGSEPLSVGRAAILKVRLQPDVNVLGTEFSLDAPPEIAVETPPLRIEESKEVDWRFQPRAAGRFNLTIRAGDKNYLKTVIVDGRHLDKVSSIKVKRSFLDELLYPGEKALPADGRIKAIEVVYPVKRLPLFGLKLHWLIAYLGLSIVFGFALKKPFRVEI